MQLNRVLEAILLHYPALQAVYLFGSCGTENEQPESDVDIAILLPPEQAKKTGTLYNTPLHLALERILNKDVDLINLRAVSTVMQKEVIAADRRIYEGDARASDEFEMLTLSLYQKLNEERAEIVADALNGGRLQKV